MKKKAKKKKSGDEGVTTSDRKVRRDHFEKLYLRWEQKEIKGIFLYELEEKLALGKKQKNKKTKCKTLLNKYALLHFSYHVLVSGDQLLPEEAQDGSIMYQNFETAWGREMCLWPGRDRAFQMCGSILWKGWNCQLGKWFIFSRGYIEMFSGISFSDNENGKNKCALVYFIWDRIKRSLQRAGHTIAWAAERGGWLNRNLMQILHLYVWSQFQEEDCQSL